MPAIFFAPAVKALGRPGFKELEALSVDYETSLLATAIRLSAYGGRRNSLACSYCRKSVNQDSFWIGVAAQVVRAEQSRRRPARQGVDATHGS